MEEEEDVEEVEEEEEDYDVVEVKKYISHNTSLPCLPPPAPPTIYDVPKVQPARSRSSWSLEPPQPSPRKYQAEPPSVSSQAVRRLFEDEEERPGRPKMSPDFSSKTLKPKKSHNEIGQGGGGGGKFRARNNSESVKQPEAVYNELSLILERRRQNLETPRPSVPDRPSNLTVDRKETFPPYSKVNKVPRQQKERRDSGENRRAESSSLTRHIQVPPLHKSFLHSFAQSGKLGKTSSEENKSSFNTFKGW